MTWTAFRFAQPLQRFSRWAHGLRLLLNAPQLCKKERNFMDLETLLNDFAVIARAKHF